MKKLIKRIPAVICAVMSLSISASAVGLDTYIFNKQDRAVPAPAPAEAVLALRGEDLGVGAFDNPQDLCIGAGGVLYIADTKNNRIVSVKDIGGAGQSAGIIETFENGGQKERFREPGGLFIDEDGNLLVADTGNARIVKLGADGGLLQIIGAPKAETLPKGFSFKPAKLALDAYRQMYVISDGYNAGLMEFDPSGQYTRSMGAPMVAVSPIEQFWRRFSTKAMRERTQSFVPTEYSNVAVDGDGFLFVTTSAYDASQYASGALKPLRKLNARGNDVFNRLNDPVGDSFTAGETYRGPSAFSGVCTLGYGDFALLDQKRGRVFAYNGDGELLYEFGGPADSLGGVRTGCAIAYQGDRFYVLDAGKRQVTVFALTEYGKLFGGIARARQEIDFETEEKLWNEVIARNANCVLAMRGLGNAAYKRKDMAGAMRYYRLAGDRENYSKAYAFVRRSRIENSVWALLLILAAFAAAAFAVSRLKNRIRAFASGRPLLRSVLYAGHVCTHPFDGFWDLKREKRGNAASASVILLACTAVSVLSSLGTGFIFNRTDLEKYSIFSVLYILAAVALWTVCQWAVTALMYGEGKLKEIYTATCYSVAPYILLNVAAVLISRALLSNEGDLYYVLISLSVAWMVYLLVISVKQTHDFSMGKTLAAILITAVVILLVVFIGMLVLALSQQLFAFVRDLIGEASLRV